ncbi:FAD dependent oxidoreductase [Daldinia vernicosa]|uniref:FAD dependent oxidoreductase n=1 Tax=Daldinia vernicosa TaxID=114800 RepID=UPI0020082EAE|nr:FAD dependent oxidoreductase [Daldinia vernicosa]KAI0851954.1 FAD dependent oxidoreductase [Daldinia vernicosa]
MNIVQEIPSDQAEIIIIGSGIAAAAAANSILVETRRVNNLRRVLVIESREMCGGGTGRGNGLLNCAPHEMFHRLRSTIGLHRAAALVRFQLAHIKVLRELCQEIDRGDGYTEFREKEMVELYLTERDCKIAFAKARLFAQWIPEFKIATFGADQARERFNVSQAVEGALSYDSATISPFHFVNSIWNTLLLKYKPFLYIMTHTNVVAIDSVKGDPCKCESLIVSAHSTKDDGYVVRTTRGNFRCNHIVHATNAFAPDLVPGLRSKMTGILGTMTAMRPGFGLFNLGKRYAWSVVHGKTCDNAMQRPANQRSPGHIITSGGFSRAAGHGTSMIGV